MSASGSRHPTPPEGEAEQAETEEGRVAEKKVRNRLTRVYARLGVTTRMEAALWFERHR